LTYGWVPTNGLPSPSHPLFCAHILTPTPCWRVGSLFSYGDIMLMHAASVLLLECHIACLPGPTSCHCLWKAVRAGWISPTAQVCRPCNKRPRGRERFLYIVPLKDCRLL
jgi:hypothetical protein